MKKAKILMMTFIILCLLPMAALVQAFSPIVSTEDLAAGLTNPGQVIVDIRKVEEYKAGHIPGAINVFYGTWAIKIGDNDNQLPADDDLVDILGSAGIKPDSTVVIYGKTDTGSDRVNITRVAWTLKYAGVEKVSVMNGGFEKWSIREKRPVTTDATSPKSISYKGEFNKKILVDKGYVLANVGKVLIVDVREPDFFSGLQKLPFVAKAGRIAGAVNLPTMQIFEKYPPGEHMEPCCWTYKDKETLKNMATGVVGQDLSREMIVYCDTGKVASVWWFVLTEVLGYTNVKNYDGSTQEWMRDPNAPILP
jgi:thiosulfate/3-mercaptopyruvate sulfurtransferase